MLACGSVVAVQNSVTLPSRTWATLATGISIDLSPREADSARSTSRPPRCVFRFAEFLGAGIRCPVRLARRWLRGVSRDRLVVPATGQGWEAARRHG
jgi:hypothetical protein